MNQIEPQKLSFLNLLFLLFVLKVQERDMVETFQKSFEMCVKMGDVASVMCSYNQVNGIPSCADPQLLKQTVRDKWKLNGYIVSDCDSIEVMVDKQKFLGDAPEDAVAKVLRAGYYLMPFLIYGSFSLFLLASCIYIYIYIILVK